MPRRPDYLFFADRKQFCQDIIGPASQLDFKRFEENYTLSTAACKRLEAVGEGASQLTAESKKGYGQTPLRKTTGMGNILIHVYHDSDLELVFNVCKSEPPNLLEGVEKI